MAVAPGGTVDCPQRTMWLQFHQIWGVSFQDKLEILTLSKIPKSEYLMYRNGRTSWGPECFVCPGGRCTSAWTARPACGVTCCQRPRLLRVCPMRAALPTTPTSRSEHCHLHLANGEAEAQRSRDSAKVTPPGSDNAGRETLSGPQGPCPFQDPVHGTVLWSLSSGLALPYVPLQPSSWGQMVAKLTRDRMPPLGTGQPDVGFAEITPSRTTRTPPWPPSASQFGSGQRRSASGPGSSCWDRVCFRSRCSSCRWGRLGSCTSMCCV